MMHSVYQLTPAVAVAVSASTGAPSSSRLIAASLPEPIARTIADAVTAALADRAAGTHEPPDLPSASIVARAIWLAVADGRRGARSYLRSVGCGGGSGDLDRVIGYAMLGEHAEAIATAVRRLATPIREAS